MHGITCQKCLDGQHVRCRGCACGCTSYNSFRTEVQCAPRSARVERAPISARRSPSFSHGSRPAVIELEGLRALLAELRPARPWRWRVQPAEIRIAIVMRENGATWREVAASLHHNPTTLIKTLTNQFAMQDFAAWWTGSTPAA